MTLEEAFRILELPSSPNWEQIQSAYRLLSKVWHPDRFPSGSELQKNAEERQRKINQAYDFLKKNFSNRTAESHKNESEYRAESDNAEIISFDAIYVGHDPRIIRKKSSCKVALGKEFIALAFDQDEYVIYRGSELMSIRLGFREIYVRPTITNVSFFGIDDDRVSLVFEDPEKLVKNIIVDLKFINDYFARLFHKKVVNSFGLISYAQVQAKAEAQMKAKEQAQAKEKAQAKAQAKEQARAKAQAKAKAKKQAKADAQAKAKEQAKAKATQHNNSASQEKSAPLSYLAKTELWMPIFGIILLLMFLIPPENSSQKSAENKELSNNPDLNKPFQIVKNDPKLIHQQVLDDEKDNLESGDTRHGYGGATTQKEWKSSLPKGASVKGNVAIWAESKRDKVNNIIINISVFPTYNHYKNSPKTYYGQLEIHLAFLGRCTWQGKIPGEYFINNQALIVEDPHSMKSLEFKLTTK